MATISTLWADERGSVWRPKINTNFTNLNVDLVEAQVDIAQLELNQIDATTSDNWFVKMSVAPVDAAIPISVGDNDTRLPTQWENNAMAGTYGTPWSGNKYVTETDVLYTGNMLITTNQTIAWIKTFSSIPVLPWSDPTTDNELCQKSYVDALFANF
jgi:hypothetical protein